MSPEIRLKMKLKNGELYMLKKLASIIISIVVCTVFISGCTVPNSQKSIVLILKAPILSFRSSAINDNVESSYDFLKKAGEEFAAQYKSANVTVEVIQYDNAHEQDNIEVCFGTGDAADVLLNDYFTMEAHVHTGRVASLDDIITEDIRSDIGDEFWELSSMSGKVYMMPYLYRQNVLAYNTELFRMAGLSDYIGDGTTVQTWTLDEWKEILAALRAALPATSYPMMMYARNNQGDTHIMSLIRSHGSTILDDSNHFNLEADEGLEGLGWIRECYKNRYIPGNAYEIDMITNYDMFQNGQLAIFPVNATSERNLDMSYGLVNFPMMDKGSNTNFLTGFEVFDNGDNDRLQVAKEFVKYIYESDYLDYATTAIPCSSKICDKYADYLKPLNKYIINSDKSVIFTGGAPNWLGVRDIFYKHIQELMISDKSVEDIAKELDADANKAIDMGYNESLLHE